MKKNNILLALVDLVETIYNVALISLGLTSAVYFAFIIVGIDVPFLTLLFNIAIAVTALVMLLFGILGIHVLIKDVFGILIQYRNPFKYLRSPIVITRVK